MKKILINLGQVIAILLMISPYFFIHNFNSFDNANFLFFLTCSILYDVYMYSVITKKEKMKEEKEKYYNYLKNIDKKMKLNLSEKDKLKFTEEYLEKIFNEYFED